MEPNGALEAEHFGFYCNYCVLTWYSIVRNKA